MTMQNLIVRTFILLIPFLAANLHVSAQSEATLSVSGEVITPLNLSVDDLKKLPQITCKTKDRDDKENEFGGVALIELLQKAGVTTGKDLRGENLVKYVLITAADGYQVLYSLPEIDPEYTDQRVMLAIEKNGKPLPANEGPFRIIAPNDKRPARWIREVRSIKIAFVKE